MNSLKSNTKKWFVLYTRSRAEKKARDQLRESGIECYLPIQKTLRQWSDRKKKVDKVVIPSYIFVYIEPNRTQDVFASDYLVAYVRDEGKPAVIPDKQIEAFKRIIESDTPFNIDRESIPKGSRVKVTFGSLKGVEGQVHEVANNKRLVIHIEQIGYSLSIKIPADYLEVIPNKE